MCNLGQSQARGNSQPMHSSDLCTAAPCLEGSSGKFLPRCVPHIYSLMSRPTPSLLQMPYCLTSKPTVLVQEFQNMGRPNSGAHECHMLKDGDNIQQTVRLAELVPLLSPSAHLTLLFRCAPHSATKDHSATADGSQKCDPPCREAEDW